MRHRTLAELDETTAAPTAWIDFASGGTRARRSHAELLADARAAAAMLAVRVSRPGGCALVGRPGYSWLVGALACMLLGRRVIAVPETLGAAEMSAAVEGLDVAAVLTDDDPAADVFPTAEIVPLAELLGAPPDEQVPAKLRMDVVAFTSGTTAQSKLKCFPVTAASTEHFAATFVDVFGLRPDDTWMVLHTFSHIVHFEYVLASLLHGLNVVLAQPIDLVLNAARYAPAAVVTVPGVYEQLADVLEQRIRRTWRGRIGSALAGALPSRWLGRNWARRLCAVAQAEVRRATGGRLQVMIIGAAPSTMALKQRLARLGLPVYEGYGMSEIGMVTCQRPGDTALGTIGRPWPGIETRVDNGVLRVRPPYRRAVRYVNVAGPSAMIADKQGWIDTGDLVRQEPSGHFVITGRRKNILITDRGRNINARAVEARLEELPGVRHAVLYGDGKPFLSAVLQLRDPAAEPEAAAGIERANAAAAEHERVLAWTVADEPFSTANELLTRTGKVRGSAVTEKYQARLEALYAPEMTPADQEVS